MFGVASLAEDRSFIPRGRRLFIETCRNPTAPQAIAVAPRFFPSSSSIFLPWSPAVRFRPDQSRAHVVTRISSCWNMRVSWSTAMRSGRHALFSWSVAVPVSIRSATSSDYCALVQSAGPFTKPRWRSRMQLECCLVSGLDDLAVMRKPVEQRRCHLGAAEHARPSTKARLVVTTMEVRP